MIVLLISVALVVVIVISICTREEGLDGGADSNNWVGVEVGDGFIVISGGELL
eukprot:CAMPEP_0202459304 /NCGR_PEP_ID=MMETSP1360-20130828/34461_1 /ASSEMBLY_ACC=CAM_ASM_000848 /TAXON_ID=515479 /ORGANISM="Licmophora paradoxa, Strain CCMP2313" /LENGTH=52 /DNA_ID=CAMNT_0049080309 /DNA_START=83 /DNA_END=238 /DNA_ORIENTATION=-